MEDTSRLVTPFMAKDEALPANIVLTSRYTAITYLPKCLFEQFRRLANVYFVVLGVIALIGTYTGYYQSAVEYDSLLAPVCIVVLISVIKEGVEDFKRHAADAKVNARPVNIVSDDSGTLDSDDSGAALSCFAVMKKYLRILLCWLQVVFRERPLMWRLQPLTVRLI
mgnify:CR=1 FL=1